MGHLPRAVPLHGDAYGIALTGNPSPSGDLMYIQHCNHQYQWCSWLGKAPYIKHLP